MLFPSIVKRIEYLNNLSVKSVLGVFLRILTTTTSDIIYIYTHMNQIIYVYVPWVITIQDNGI